MQGCGIALIVEVEQVGKAVEVVEANVVGVLVMLEVVDTVDDTVGVAVDVAGGEAPRPTGKTQWMEG